MVGAVNALESIKGLTMLELKIAVDETHPHQSLDTCIALVSMIEGLLDGKNDLGDLTAEGIFGLSLQLRSVVTAMGVIRDAVEAKIHGEDKPNERAVTPRLTEPKGRRSAAA